MIAVTGDNLLRHELIGLKVEVVRSSNPLLMGIKGVVIDETKNTLVVKVNSGKKRLPKDGVTYGFSLSNGTFIEVEGRQLLDRPVDRIGRRRRGRS